jgi:hypothetical protein
MLWLVPRDDCDGNRVWYYRFSYQQPHQDAVASDQMAEAA